MELFAIALLVLTSVLLIISLSFIIIKTRHKEKMALLEKGLDPKEYMFDRFLPNTLRTGMFLLGVGLGFLFAFSFDEFIVTTNENPAIYPGSILIFGGISQILFYRIYSKKKL
ncbi:hypothetical protein POV27_11615 [Aureisphaera galaxeae]|uniref:DUF6249 domain-containing protein n=1 Tax=Aureisphaera galaxeae TaxID=1538023 RepID=UPI00235028AB|nr:DUF6249 domain-containing protein [Aureisphaera galaxeae]MDC8004700.1 hypothetical protein [Aureisphaera galaxeae]